MYELNKEIKFKELSNEWLKNATLGVTYTYQVNLCSYVNHLNRAFGEKLVYEIKPNDIDKIIRELYNCNPNTHRPASKKFLKNIISCATRIFDFAVENEIIYKNPAKHKKKSIPKNAVQKVVNAITPEQQQFVINTEHRAKIAAVIMMFMGLRTGELLALEWSDADLENYKIYIHQRLQRISGNKYT